MTKYFTMGKRGRWYHRYPNCIVLSLAHGDLELLKRVGFVEVTLEDIKRRKLRPCLCANDEIDSKIRGRSPDVR